MDRGFQLVSVLMLALVGLEREGLPFLNVQDLAEVPVGDRPAKLVAPRFVDLGAIDPPELRPEGPHVALFRRCPRARPAELRLRPCRPLRSRRGSTPPFHSRAAAPSSHPPRRT